MSGTYLSVGRIKKPHGLSGAFNFTLTRELKSLTQHPTHFFIARGANYVPYFIEKIDWRDIHAGLLKFEEISVVEQAKAIAGSELYLDGKVVAKFFKKEADEYGYLIGYILYDGDRAIGKIEDLFTLPSQLLLAVEVAGVEVLVPLAEDLIVSEDAKQKILVMNIPEGLVDYSLLGY